MSIDYHTIAQTRKKNYQYLDSFLKDKNKFPIKADPDDTPMSYPYLSYTNEIKKKLIYHRIYIPTYWTNIYNLCSQNSLEYKMTDNLLCIPIDQRMQLEDISCIWKYLYYEYKHD